MTVHCVSYYEEPNGFELIEVDYQCSAACMRSTLEREVNVTGAAPAGSLNLDDGSVSWGAYPCGEETDYDVYCSACGDLLWHGLEVTA